MCRRDQRLVIFAAFIAIPINIERAKRRHRKWRLDRCIRVISSPRRLTLVTLYLYKMRLDSGLPKCLSNGTFRKSIDSTYFKDTVLGCESVGVLDYCRWPGLAKLPLTKTTSTAAYAAVAAKTSERLAVDKTLTEKAKRTVHIVSNPNLAVGPVTKYSDRIAPTRRIPAIRILSAPTAFEIRVSGR